MLLVHHTTGLEETPGFTLTSENETDAQKTPSDTSALPVIITRVMSASTRARRRRAGMVKPGQTGLFTVARSR